MATIPGSQSWRMSEAQSVVEYALIVAAIAVLLLLGGYALGNQLHTWFTYLVGRITGVMGWIPVLLAASLLTTSAFTW